MDSNAKAQFDKAVREGKVQEAGVSSVGKAIAKAVVEKFAGKEAARIGAKTFDRVVAKTPEPNINTAGGARTVKASGDVSVKSAKGSTTTTPDARSITVNKPPLSEAQADTIRGMHYAKIANEANKAASSAAESSVSEVAKAKLKTAAAAGAAGYAVAKGTQKDHAVTDNNNHTKPISK